MTEKIDLFPICPEGIVDKSVTIYGASKTGKSYIIADLLYTISRQVKQIIVFSATDFQTGQYSSKMVKPPLVHEKPTDDILERIWKRQEALSATYTRANNIITLERLFKRLAIGYANKILDQAQKCRNEAIAQIDAASEDVGIRQARRDEVEKKFNEFFKVVYKHFISQNIENLKKMALTSDERLAIRYLYFNPKMVIVFDDVSEQFKKLGAKGKEYMHKMLYQGRWVNLTVIIGVHDATSLTPELRKNSHLNMFTTDRAAFNYFCSESNGFSKREAKDRIKAVNGQVFATSGPNKYQKLVYDPSNDTFYKYTATNRVFEFGADCINEFCEMIKKDGASIDPNNEFNSYFTGEFSAK
jgi:hypothetical protein